MAARGIESCSPKPRPSLSESHEFGTRAATEGRPYSTYRGTFIIENIGILRIMKRLLYLLCTLVLVASGISGQKTKPTDAADPSSWSQYTVPGEEFSVALPSRPAMKTSKEFRSQIQRERKERNLRITFQGVNYGIDVFENPTHLSLENFVAEYTREADFKGSTERAITVDGVNGKDYSTAASPFARVQFFATARRLYRFIAVGGNADSAAVKHFFSSVSFGKDDKVVKLSDGPGMPLELNTGERVYTGKELDRRVRIINKPEPEAPPGARGLVVLQTIFSGDGKVVNIKVVSSPGENLTNAAIRAAQKLKFEPAIKDGKPVSMYMTLEYHFN